MARYAHGRGKESYRRFSRTIKDEQRDIISAIKSGEDYTQNDVFRFLDRVVNEYYAELRANELDVELWGSRAVDYAYKLYTQIISTYDLDEGGTFEEKETPEPEEKPDEIPEPGNENGTLFGVPVMNKSNKALIKAQGRDRKRVLLTLEELSEYVQGVPYILAIQIVRTSTGEVASYRVWVQAAKEKKKKRSA